VNQNRRSFNLGQDLAADATLQKSGDVAAAVGAKCDQVGRSFMTGGDDLCCSGRVLCHLTNLSVGSDARRIQLAGRFPHVLLQRGSVLWQGACFGGPDHENLTPAPASQSAHDGQHAFGQALWIHCQDDSPVHLRLRL